MTPSTPEIEARAKELENEFRKKVKTNIACPRCHCVNLRLDTSVVISFKCKNCAFEFVDADCYVTLKDALEYAASKELLAVQKAREEAFQEGKEVLF